MDRIFLLKRSFDGRSTTLKLGLAVAPQPAGVIKLFLCKPFQLQPPARLSMKDYHMTKKSKRRAWTKADVSKLKALARKKTHASSIARLLKRTEGATRQRAFSMGLSLDSRV
jgi:hypothetical protein